MSEHDNKTDAEVVELADALDSKSSVGDYVRVRVPPSAPIKCSFKTGAIFLL